MGAACRVVSGGCGGDHGPKFTSFQALSCRGSLMLPVDGVSTVDRKSQVLPAEGLICSGLRTVTLGLANKGVCGPAMCANTRPRGPTLMANKPTLVCEGLANTPVGQHALRTG